MYVNLVFESFEDVPWRNNYFNTIIFVCTAPVEWCVFEQDVCSLICSSIRACIRLPRNVRLCNANNTLYLEAEISPCICSLTRLFVGADALYELLANEVRYHNSTWLWNGQRWRWLTELPPLDFCYIIWCGFYDALRLCLHNQPLLEYVLMLQQSKLFRKNRAIWIVFLASRHL